MHETAEQATLTVLRRARDPGGLATSSAVARDFLSRVQQIANLGLQAVLVESTLVTDPQRQVYPLTLVPEAGRVIAVRQGERDLSRAAWTWLRHVDRRWSRAVGARLEAWAPLGRTHLILHPGLPDAASVTVVSVKITTALSDPTVLLELPDELLPPVYDLAEALLLLKLRKLEAVTDLRARVESRIAALQRRGVV